MNEIQTDHPSSLKRKSTQTVLYTLLQSLPRLIAPITPFLAEEIYSHSIENDQEKSVFEDGYTEMKAEWNNQEVEKAWGIFQIR